MATAHTLEDVRQYWNEYVNDIEVTNLPVGSSEFFDALERYRYDKIDYLRSYVDFPRYRGKKVLEIGCGAGIDLMQFARAGALVSARDLTENAVDLTKRNLAREGYSGDIRQGNAEALDFAEDTFDVVYSHGVLHHTVDTEKSISEVHRVLKPGGEAVVMLYNRISWFHFVSWISRTNVEHKDKDAPIIRMYTTSECRELFQAFENVRIHVDRFPRKTVKFENLFAKLNNYLLVPFFEILPDAIRRPFGWHIMIRANK
ncbi:MAG: class I SAM-dependent methyltransferase [Vicinamibacteria bacterium]